ncbi:MAG: ATP-binding protein [Leptospiraceae bacterium]|nr:ATP-binding protein [Leptospiraceae bacterium]
MKRRIYKNLLDWKNSKERKPLLIRGARQVGKSHLIKNFGKKNYKKFLEVNFELYPEVSNFFNSLNPEEIIKNLSIYFNQEITNGTLIFFDEIQECPQAITSLRYFYELKPELHVIGAGSLLEFVLNSSEINIPVGRIEYLFMYPLSFIEFLETLNENLLIELLQKAKSEKEINPVIHQKLLKLYRDYTYIGGMPEAMSNYTEERNYPQIKKIQTSLLQTYRDDFGKYSNLAKHKYLHKVFLKAPSLIGKIIKYSEIDRETPSRELKEALSLLEYAGLITRITSTTHPELPLSVYSKENQFKIHFLDIGLVIRAMLLEYTVVHSENIMGTYSGGLAEQFVLQELAAYNDPYEKREMYFWKRDKRGSSAEIDTLIVYNSIIIPVEVKSGKTGSLKSLQLYKKLYNPNICIRYSEHQLSFYDSILSIPLYMISETNRLLNYYLK